MLSHASQQLLSELPQLPGEETDAYICFIDWVQHGAPEIGGEAWGVWLRLVTHPSAVVGGWSQGYGWDERLRCSGYARRARLLTESTAQALQSWVESNKPSKAARKLLNNTLAKLLAVDAMGADPVVALEEGVRAYKALRELERLEEGDVTERKELTFPDLKATTTDNLLALREQIANEDDDK